MTTSFALCSPNFLASAALLFLGVLQTFAAQHPCGAPDWRYSPHNQKCYKLFDTKVGWTISEFQCAFKGGHHPSIHDIVENQFVSELAKQAGIVWLGAAQFGSSQNYVWADNTPFSFEHWKNGQRPRYHKGKKCSKLDGRTGEWLQSCCKVPAAFICQKPASIIEDNSGLEATGQNAGSAEATSDFRSRTRVLRH
ncbi:Protein CLEC-1 [Aphelenchoides avenae]|nr:Protein CLEC-1 [Aphelenchus avenae]